MDAAKANRIGMDEAAFYFLTAILFARESNDNSTSDGK